NTSALFTFTPTRSLSSLSLHDALPISVLARLDAIDELEDDHRCVVAGAPARLDDAGVAAVAIREARRDGVEERPDHRGVRHHREDRKSTRLNSSHQIISYAVFCLKKKK